MAKLITRLFAKSIARISSCIMKGFCLEVDQGLFALSVLRFSSKMIEGLCVSLVATINFSLMSIQQTACCREVGQHGRATLARMPRR